MSEIAENIPTLTDVVKKGDESMLNHFSAEQFISEQTAIPDDLQEGFEDNTQDIMEVSSIIENASTFENTDADLDEIPSITLDDSSNDDIAGEDFSESMQLETSGSEADITNLSEKIEIDTDTNDIKEKINEAVEATLPAIEAQLKEQLYKQFKV